METGNTTIDNNKHLSIGKSPDDDKIRGKGKSAFDTSHELSNDGGENDKRLVNTSHGNKVSYDNNKLIAPLKKTPHPEAHTNNTFEIYDSTRNTDLGSNMACNPTPSPLRYETEGIGNGSSTTTVTENKQVSNPTSPLSITGIVQRNLGHASDPNLNVKESIYNFDEEEEQSIAPSTMTPNISASTKEAKHPFSKAIHLNNENKSHQKLSSNPIAAAYISTNKIKDRPTPAMIFVAKKSRPVLENEGLDEKQARSKKKQKKKHSKKLLKEKETKKPANIEKIDQRILSLDTSRDLYKEGYLVWGKIRGFSYWPGIITVDPMDGLTVKFMKQNSDIPYSHVHFLGYERTQRAWLPETNIMEFKGIDHFVMMASKIPPNSAKKKDFTPKKTLMERFEKGMDLAESVLPLSFRQRLEKLDLVYVLIPALKEKEEKDYHKSPEEQEEGTKYTKGVKRKRKSGDYDSENSATSGKNKKRKNDNEKLEPISLNQIIHVSDTELSSQVEVGSSQSLEHEYSEDQSTVKKPKHKRSKSVNDQKIKKLKLATNGNKISKKKVKKPEEPKLAKRGKKKKQIKEPMVSDVTVKSEKMAKKLNSKRKKLIIDSAIKDEACIDSPNEKQKFGDTEECGMGVTVRVSSPIEDTSETEIKDISGSLKTDEFDSDLDEPIEMDDSTNNTQFKAGYHGEFAMVPKLGSLVWGRLPGFPYWPCFVTKCPDTGEYRRMYDANKRCDYHVQFFNWNNESGKCVYICNSLYI